MLITLDDRRVHYDVVGPQDAPVVCLAHSLAADGGMWAEQVAPLLAAGYRVLRPDMRGHGGTEAAPGDYTMDLLADDLHALLGALGIETLHLVGLSVGAMIGQSFAVRYGAKLRSLVLCDTQPAAGEGARAAWSMPLSMVRQRGNLVPVATGMLRAWLGDAYKAAHPRRWEEIRATILATTPRGFEGCVAAMSTFDDVARLPQVATPALVVCGGDDPMTKPAECRKVAELIPGARYEEIAGARHLVNVEAAEAFTRLLLDWLAAR